MYLSLFIHFLVIYHDIDPDLDTIFLFFLLDQPLRQLFFLAFPQRKHTGLIRRRCGFFPPFVDLQGVSS